MSMISAQIDKLRKYANKVDGTFPMLASAMRDAADTIWELRDDLQRANAAVQDAEHDESMAWDRVRKAEAENAKLRELVRDYRMFLALAELAQPIGSVIAAHGHPTLIAAHGHPTLSVKALDKRYRELGVEV